MADISIEDIKRLRALTGVGITDAKQALQQSGGDFDKALSEMRKKGLTKAEKRGEREARAGLISSYVHDGRIGVLVEVNCETDFVAKTDEFKELVKDLALHICAAAPLYVNLSDIPKEDKVRAESEFIEKIKAEGKPDEVASQIVEGMLKKHFAEKILLEQPFVKDPQQTVGELVKQANATLGENIVVRRFYRMALGELS